mgnify:CR=1 FL=1
MIVVATVAKGNSSKSNIFGFCSDCNSSNGKVNKRRTICEKLVGNGSVMDNYAGCGSSCNNHNIG